MKVLVLIFDFDGVIIPTKGLIGVALKYFKKYFNIQVTEEGIAKGVSSLSGGTFAEAYQKALRLFVPGYDEERDKEKAERCYQEINEERAAIYKGTEVFPEVVDVLQRLSKNFHLIISSGLERTYIEEVLTKNGIINLFEAIYSVVEDGGKERHIQMVRESYPGKKILIIGDATLEMQLGVPAIGMARNSSQEQPLRMAGAKAVINSLNGILDLDLDSL